MIVFVQRVIYNGEKKTGNREPK